MSGVEAEPAMQMHEKGIAHECGVFAVHGAPGEAAFLAKLGLGALQHRGQEGAGIAASDGEVITVLANHGLVSEVFSNGALDGFGSENMSLGHVRYSTNGSKTDFSGVQPFHHMESESATAQNGNITNAEELCERFGVDPAGRTDSRIVSDIISSRIAETSDPEAALGEILPVVEGAFSGVLMHSDKLYAFRDRQGIRPLVLGALPGFGTAVASETSALDTIGAEYYKDVKPGTLEIVSKDGSQTAEWGEQDDAFCVFEEVYFADPAHRGEDGTSMHALRKNMGEILFRESPVEADLVVGVPDSGRSAATGYAAASGIPQDEGLLKNRYSSRSFTAPTQDLRERMLQVKHNPIKDMVDGQRLVVVDDSLVRGNTTRRIVHSLREAGASEVHLRISSPPIVSPCFYGIDIASREELIAFGRTEEEVAEAVGADSLKYLSKEGLSEAVGDQGTRCKACFTGEYPVEIKDSDKLAQLGDMAMQT